MLDLPHDVEQRQELFQRMSAHLKFELQLQHVVTRCCIAVARNGLRTMSPEQERSLDTLLIVFLDQIESITPDDTSSEAPVLRFLVSLPC